MPEECFVRPGSNPPVCGVHNVPLLLTKTSDPDPEFRHYVCPVSGKTIKQA